jgi:hypothetical protein
MEYDDIHPPSIIGAAFLWMTGTPADAAFAAA